MSEEEALEDAEIKRIRNLVSDSKSAITFSREFLNNLTAKFADEEVTLAQALWAHHRLHSFSVTISAPIATARPLLAPLVGVELKIDVLNLILSGHVLSAYVCLGLMAADDMGQAYHCLSTERLTWMKDQLSAYLGV